MFYNSKNNFKKFVDLFNTIEYVDPKTCNILAKINYDDFISFYSEQQIQTEKNKLIYQSKIKGISCFRIKFRSIHFGSVS